MCARAITLRPGMQPVLVCGFFGGELQREIRNDYNYYVLDYNIEQRAGEWKYVRWQVLLART